MGNLILEFLEARIAEDEKRARDFEHALALAINGDYGNYDACYGAPASWSTVERLGFTPARVLAECAAKREIIAVGAALGHEYNDDDAWYSCGLATGFYDDTPGSGCSDESKHGRCTCGLEERRMRSLGPIAAVYKDHPDYAKAFPNRPSGLKIRASTGHTSTFTPWMSSVRSR